MILLLYPSSVNAEEKHKSKDKIWVLQEHQANDEELDRR